MKKIRTMGWRRRALALLLGGSLALAAPLPALGASLAGLDTALSPWLDSTERVRFSATMELSTWLPFTQERLDMMNRLLAYTPVQASITQEGEDSRTHMQLAVRDSLLFTLEESQGPQGYQLQTSLLPNRTLESSALSPMDILSGSSQEEDTLPFQLLEGIREAEECYPALMAACEPYAEKKKANYKIKGIGTAKWSEIARLTPEQSGEMLPQLRAVLACGMDGAYREELSQVTFGKGFIVGLYKTAQEGDDLAVYMKGTLLHPDGRRWELAYQWAFTRDGEQQADSFSYKSTSGKKPRDNRTIEATFTQSLSQSKPGLKGSTTITQKQGTLITEYTEKTDLSGQGGSSPSLKGSYSLEQKITDGEKSASQAFILSPDLALLPEAEGQALITGTAALELRQDKTVTTGLTFVFADQAPPTLDQLEGGGSLYAVTDTPATQASSLPPTSSLSQNAEEDPEPEPQAAFLVGGAPIGLQDHAPPTSPTTLRLDTLEAPALEALRMEAAQSLAGHLLRAYLSLPQEDQALLADGMTEADYQAFLDLAKALEQP